MYYNKECAWLTVITALLAVAGWETFSRIWGPGYFAKDLNVLLVGTVILAGDLFLRVGRLRLANGPEVANAPDGAATESSGTSASTDESVEVVHPLRLFLESNRGAAYGWFPGWAVGTAIIIGCLMQMK